MLRRILILKDEVNDELDNIQKLLVEVNQIKSENLPEAISSRVYATLLMDFYTGVERIFQLIGGSMEEELPSGDDWHRQLLRQMSLEMPGIRPAVIDKKFGEKLAQYLKFRHVVRNIYGFQLEKKKYQLLLNELPEIMEILKRKVRTFMQEMEQMARELD